jgi:hypothetical protein
VGILGRPQTNRCDGDGGGRVGQQALGFASHRRTLVGGAFRSSLRALAAVECVIEGEAVVALADRVLRTGQGIDRAFELLGA